MAHDYDSIMAIIFSDPLSHHPFWSRLRLLISCRTRRFKGIDQVEKGAAMRTSMELLPPSPLPPVTVSQRVAENRDVMLDLYVLHHPHHHPHHQVHQAAHPHHPPPPPPILSAHHHRPLPPLPSWQHKEKKKELPQRITRRRGDEREVS